MLLFAGFLNLFSSYLIASIVENFLAIYVAFFGFVILNLEILSLFNGIYNYNILIFSCLNLIFSYLFFRYKKAKFLKPDIDFKRIKNALLLDKILIILTLAFFVLILVSGFLAYIMPPVEPDSQTYHFFRAYMFYKNHNLAHFDTNDIRAVIMPINSEILYTWILALKQKFYNFAFVSYLSYFAVIGAIWQILSCLKYSIRKKIFSIFLFSSLASTVVEMSCLQTDIVVGALYICALAFFINKKNFLSSLSLAIALGVKTTAFILFVPYLTIIFLLNKKEFLRYIFYLILNFIVFSSYNYILNFLEYQNPITNNSAYLGHRFWGGIHGYIANLIHFSFQFFDFTGFAWGYYINDKLFALKDIIFDIININPEIGSNVSQQQVNIRTDEQVIGFGVLGFFAFIPAIFKGFFAKRKIIMFLAFAFVLNILILARFMAFMEYSMRFALSFACFSAPVFVLIYKKSSIYKALIAFFCVFYMSVIPFFINRAPFYKIFPNLVLNNFNLEKFNENCFLGDIVEIWYMTPIIYDIIKERYPNARKIGYFKTEASSALYLKKKLDIDFLTAGKIDEYDLDRYDVLIFEGETQDDNVFKEAKIEYILQGNNVKFQNNNISCYYTDIYNEVTTIKQYAKKRHCFTHHYVAKNSKFKLNYFYDYEDANINKTRIYFFTKLN